VDCGDRALSDLPVDHASCRDRQGLLAWVHGFRRATVAARSCMDEGKRHAATQHAAPDPRTWPIALARLRGPVDRCLAEQRVEQRPQRRHDALLPTDDRTADGGGPKRWSKTVGSPRAVSAPRDPENQAWGVGDRSLGSGNLVACARRATAADIREHFIRWKYVNLPAALGSLEKQGRIVPVGVHSWPGTWYVHAEDVALLDRIEAGQWIPRTTVLSPFDNLIIDRRRTSRMFGFDYTMEIYVPAAKRLYGYYAMPVLFGDRLVARVDPAFNRGTTRLAIRGIRVEPGYDDLQ